MIRWIISSVGVVALLSSASLRAQTFRGGITGTMTDSSGAVVGAPPSSSSVPIQV